LLFQLAPLAPFASHALRQRAVRLPEFDQVGHRGQQALVVPGLGQVVGGAGLYQVDRRIEMGPGGEQDHRQVRMARADFAEQGHAFLARGGVGGEVHVLDHQVDAIAPRARQQRQSFLGRGRMQRRDVVQRKQHVEGDADGGVVVNDEYSGHGR